MGELAPKNETALADLRSQVSRMGPEWSKALPKHITPERFQRVVLTAIMNSPVLITADRRSLFNAATRAAQDGLLPDGREAALVMFKGQVQYMPMIGGLLKLVRNSGDLQSIEANVVYSGDQFEYWIDEEGTHLTHRPTLDDEGKVTHVYAIARTKDGGRYIEVMTRTAIEKVRSVSRAKESGPWVTWWDEMARKTVLRRLCKRLPMSTDIDVAFEDVTENAQAGQNVVQMLERQAPPVSKLDQFAGEPAVQETAGPVIDDDTGEVLTDET
jgi:recombination protein RecT